jgi:hypothetical protein
LSSADGEAAATTGAAGGNAAWAIAAATAGGELHVELTHDIRRKGGGQGARGLGKHGAQQGTAGSGVADFGGAARGDIARVLSYPWEDGEQEQHRGDHTRQAGGIAAAGGAGGRGDRGDGSGGAACGYGRVRLEMISGAAAASSNARGQRGGTAHTHTRGDQQQARNHHHRRCLTVGADMCAVLDGPSSSGTAQGPQLIHSIDLRQTPRALSSSSSILNHDQNTLDGTDATAEHGEHVGEQQTMSSPGGLGVLLCFRAHYGEPPLLLPLPLPRAAAEEEEGPGGGGEGVEEEEESFAVEYLLEWCPGHSTEWKVTSTSNASGASGSNTTC